MSEAPNRETFGYEEDFQRSVVAAALKDPTFLIQNTDVLLPSYFDYDYLSSLLRTCRELLERLGKIPTKVTMVEELKSFCAQFHLPDSDRDGLLNQLDGIYAIEVADLDYIRDRVADFGQRQAMRGAVLKIVTLFNSKKNSAEVNEESRHLLEEALRVGVSTRDMGISLYPMLEDIPRLAAVSSSGLGRKIPTMFPTLDDKTHGGPGRGELWAVLGMSGRGKSALLVNLGVAALKNGHGVVHYTVGDLNEIDVGVRYAERLTLSTSLEVISGSENYLRKARNLAKYNPHLHIKYFASQSATMGHIRAHLAKLLALEDFKPGMVIIDYPEELRRAYDDNLYMSGEANYSQASAIAHDFDCLVWVATQPKEFHPRHKNEVLTGDNVNESKRKYQKLDGLITWNMSYDDEKDGKARIWVDKTRRWKSYYTVYMDVNLDKMLIREGNPPVEESK